MKFYKTFLFLLFYIFPLLSFSYEYDKLLSNKLTEDYISLIKKNKTGREFYKNYKSVKTSLPKIYLRYSNESGLAWYEKKKDIIYFNTRYIMIFFDIKDYTDEKIIQVLYFSSATRKEFVKYSDVVYFHELVHSLQDFKYGDSRYYKDGLFIELEYEAYLLSDMYFFDKMKKNKNLFLKIISGEYSDVYTSEYSLGFMSFSSDIEEYKKNISLRYLNEINGYVSLNEEEKRRKYQIDERKIISYAIGYDKDIQLEQKEFEKLKKHKEEYNYFLNDYYKNTWPKFSYDALKFIIEQSYIAKNYTVFFNAAYYYEKNISLYKFKTDKKIQEFEAVMYLDFLDFIKTYDRNDFEFLSSVLMAFDKFSDITERPVPQWLAEIRDKSFEKTYHLYKDMVENEKDDVKKNYYIESIKYFCSKLKDLSCDNLIK